MIALVVSASPVVSSLSFYLTACTLLIVGIVFAPQPVKRDKRVIALVGVLIVLAIGVPVFAADTTICKYAPWALECWLF